MAVSGCAMLWGNMKHRIGEIVAAVTPVIAILVIWRLLTDAIAAGGDGVFFIGGVAAISGLGGFEIKEYLIRRRSTSSKDRVDDEK